MDPDTLSAESAFPPPPPLLPPPVPPPLVNAAEPAQESSSLWRWNDRLALAAGGLTLLLLGVISGRVMTPVAPSDHGEVESVAAAAHLTSESQPWESAPDLLAAGAVSEVEVNPPELAVAPESPEPPTIAKQAPPASAAAPQTAPAPQPAEQQVTASSPSEETVEANPPTPLSAASATFPVSLEGKVPTIKLSSTTQVCGLEKKSSDRKLNTALTWAESVSEANERAEEEEKLVFLIHVSGNFEMPGFT
jgi:hypothetical protein